MIRSCSYLKDHLRVLVAGLALLSMALAPHPASAQWLTSGSNIYYNNGNVGIGTQTPSQKLELTGNLKLSAGRSVIFTTGDNTTTHVGGVQFLTDDNGVDNIWTPTDQTGTPLNSNIRLGGMGLFNNNVVNLLVSGSVGIGTTNPQYLLSVKGTVGAEEFIVTNTGWSDYVFRPDYRLRPLSEVSQYIQANGHLPDIPTEAEVKEKGVSIGDMQAKLLAKVEELTLHMIQQEKDNRELRDKMNEQTKEIQDLRERLAKGATADSTTGVAK